MNLSAGLGVGVMENAVKVVKLLHNTNNNQWLNFFRSVKLKISFIGETMNLLIILANPVSQAKHWLRDR